MTRGLTTRVALAVSVMAAMAVAASSCSVGDLDLAGHGCPCAGGFVCDTTRNVCVPATALPPDSGTEASSGPCLGDGCTCTSTTDCKDPQRPLCVDATCVECSSSPDTCGTGRHCLPSHLCAPGCKSDDECMALSPSAPRCNVTRHQCVNCTADGDCTNGQKCSPAGACVDACSAGTCAGGKACCSGLCLDTQTDPLNCNACGNACGGAQTECCAGTCTDPLTTASNCGQCGTRCSTLHAGPSCVAGSCKFNCDPGFSHCEMGNTGCETNTATSTTQCGGCNTNCNATVVRANGVACVASACTYASCLGGYYDCDGKKANGCECTTPSCGAATQVCCPGNVCVAGQLCEVAPPGDGKCH